MKLSDLNPEDVDPVAPSSVQPTAPGLKLSDLKPDDVEAVQQPDLASIAKDADTKAQSNISAPESFGQGLVTGSTLGFSDELGGAEGAMMEKLFGNPDKKSTKELYQEYRDFQRHRNKQFEQANPKSSLAGNIAGAMATGAAIPGATSLGGATALGATQGLGSSNADLTSGAPGDVAQAAKDTAIGAGLGAGGQMLGSAAGKMLNPQSLEAAGSKMATSVVGGKPSKELATQWVKQGEHWVPEQGSDIVKGIGKTAVEEGALPTTGGASAIYDKTLDAIDKNESKLNPLLKQAQSSLDDNLEGHLDDVGHVGDKMATFMNDFLDKIPTTSKKEGLTSKIFETYAPKMQEVADADGNLVKLNALKQEFQQSARELNKGIYNNPNQMETATEAQFVKQLGGIVKQHIEDLANSATGTDQLGQQIQQTNKTLSNLYTYEDMARKAMDSGKGAPKLGLKNVAGGAAGFAVAGYPGMIAGAGAQYAAEKAMGQSTGQLGKILGAKALLGAAKTVDTPMGALVQKTAPPVINNSISNPFSTERAQSATGTYADKISSSLYNATDESLKNVASKLSQDPQSAHAADELSKAIDLKDEQRKNNAIFLLLQKPSARKYLNPEE